MSSISLLRKLKLDDIPALRFKKKIEDLAYGLSIRLPREDLPWMIKGEWKREEKKRKEKREKEKEIWTM